MLKKKLFNYSAKLPVRFINRVENEEYLERYYLGEWFGFTAYLHRFVSPDGDEEIHDHPWRAAISLILCGGYAEERMDRLCAKKGWVSHLKEMKPWRINFIRGGDFHRIQKTKPETWTLFIHRPHSKTWGFLKKVEGGTLYHQPFDIRSTKNWHLKAPLGGESKRSPLK